MDYISVKEFCKELSISIATGRNWIKSGKLTPEFTDKKQPYFTRQYIDKFKKDIQSDSNKVLKSRRNKKYVSGNSLYNSYIYEQSKNIVVLQKLLAIIEREHVELSTIAINSIVANCFLQLFLKKQNKDSRNEHDLLPMFLANEFSTGEYDLLINDLIEDRNMTLQFCREHPFIFEMEYTLEPNEDTLGLIWISCNNIGKRKATGTYYTPTKIVKKLISKLDISDQDRVLDPCCGTGNFLLQLPSDIPFENIYGNDMDHSSFKIARLNMALRFSEVSALQICEHITNFNYLTEYMSRSFQFIIGNPPWGFVFSEAEKARLKKEFKATSGKNIESYDVFIEHALNNLSVNGQLSFILPEAILNVRSHKDIREILLQKNSIKYLEFLGNVFDGVQCPCILLQILHTDQPMSTIGMMVNRSNTSFTINNERAVTAEYFSFLTSDEEYRILDKIKHCDHSAFLAKNADFALGIVTGNNKEFITREKTDENEMILKGMDLRKYRFIPTDNYIVFKPEAFQQTAPTELYRAPEKLLYRFISRQLVFAYDDKQTLSLNSCNIG
ncbi:MAG: N-6 DNA methylase [Lachnospiraceae bacterium]